ncbi:hypothetical protein LCGC14_3090900 [marine sediment metagenome]|uniref:Uncharacterized protein n=1 Tax=marine sediment metagenome TaxID=412755 RepID=A0A0F8YHX9_9ZZZZ
MANAATVVRTRRGRGQFGGFFSEFFQIQATILQDVAVAITDTFEYNMTLTGVALGDMVIGWSLEADLNDGTDSAIGMVTVSAANQVRFSLLADKGEFAAGAIASGTVFKALIGRPSPFWAEAN